MKLHNVKRPSRLISSTNTSQLVFSTQILFVIVVFASKVAACLLVHRLTCHKIQRVCALTVVAASVVFCIISLMILSVGIGDHQPWIHQQDEAETVVSLVNKACIKRSLLTRSSTDPQMDHLHNTDQLARRLHRSTRHSPSLQPRNESRQKGQNRLNLRAPSGVRTANPNIKNPSVPQEHQQQHLTPPHSLTPISILRLLRLSHTLQSPAYNYTYVSVEVLTQAEMCYNVLTATLPSLSMFLASAHTGLLELGGTDKMASTYGYGSASRRNGTPRATIRSGNGKGNTIASNRAGGVEAFELTEQVHGGTSSAVTAAKARRGSLSSDDSERAIIRVQRTVSLRYDR